ncbi:GUN4 domain-containing protein [Plectonema cf. radiosum LEGE 06105]|uniref:GUN4 domain-containing protein n=1 Tax=Plectonema cf. radiosum LEGE 06105 TaxID=945769 RepID=A0A8J7K1C3_9CYAN|nr:GUN4 domain-containing protein [Plectonema radiosum]MBE9211692.1 GUN4 domain-containing protein [Plectonema cf. radiosum LEGE 06105]
MVDYIFSGSLPENASTYVTRDADGELYDGLQAGKFCYVLNSRQSGKSSLRVQTMRRLRENGVECAAIDLSAGGIQNVPPEQWYADLIDTLIDSFDLDVDFGEWWGANQLNSLVTKFRKFLEEILLVEVKENIVIFIDEIDSVLSLNFPTDDFFAFIRSCYNQRVDNPAYNRLTFCLLGVASPSNLIQDKQRTPFNIGKAISLQGFQLHEVEPLVKGLKGKFSEPQAVMQEILDWTKGQPFLTQKLCQFMVEESEKENPRTVEEVVRSKIIENWESQDEPEHLRTIRARILSNEERAGYLLDLYQQVRRSEVETEITADNTLEQSELLLSGLVARREGKLRVYNLIYKQVFNENWVENELKNLRPYSESFKFWVASGGKDESRLLRGKALIDAKEWGKDKNLSYQDKQFLAASREKEIQEKIAADEQAAKLERERKDKEAVEKRNLVLSEANQKAKRRIAIGSFILVFTLSFTAISSLVAANKVREASKTNEYLATVETLAKLAGQLEDESSDSEAKELFSQAGQSVNIKDHKLRLAILNAGISYAYQKLKLKDLEEAQKNLDRSKQQIKKQCKLSEQNIPNEASQFCILTLKTSANLLREQKKSQEAIREYQSAYKYLEKLKSKGKRGNKTVNNISPPFQDTQIKILSKENVEALHREFIDLLSKAGNENLKSQVKESLKEHYLDELNNLLANKKWQEADQRTDRLMLYVANRESSSYLDIDSLKTFSCKSLQDIDSLWVKHSDERFGFSVQKQIWVKTGNRLGIIEPSDEDGKNFKRFISRVGWYDSEERAWKNYAKVIEVVDKNYQQAPVGTLPHTRYMDYGAVENGISFLALRLVNFNI